METNGAIQSPAIREAGRVLDNITEAYFDRPLPFSGKGDARKFIRSKLLYAQSIEESEFTVQEIEICKDVLSSAEAGRWNPMINEIRRISRDFMNVPDHESARTGRALINLAFSIPTDKST